METNNFGRQSFAVTSGADFKVSVIIAAYNASRTIGETLSSVTAQTYPNLEVIVVDDGSTDDTAAVVERYRAQDTRIRLVTQANAGVAQARNHALSLATGDYIAPIDADDLWRPNKIASQLNVMLLPASSPFRLVYTWFALIDANGLVQQVLRPSYGGEVLHRLFYGNFVGNASSPLMRTQDVVRVGGYDTTLRDRAAQGCEDWKLYLKLGEVGPFAVVEAPLTGYRITPRSMSGNIAQMIRSYKLVMSEYLASYTEHQRTFRGGERFLTKYYLRQAFLSGNYQAVFDEAVRIYARDPVLGLDLLWTFLRGSLLRRTAALAQDDDPTGVHFLDASFPPDEARGRFKAIDGP